MKNYISMFIMIIVGFVLQTTIFRSLQIADVSPNILVILTAIAGTMYGQYNGLFTGVVCGLFIDLMYSSVVGVNIFIYAVIGFIMGITDRGLVLACSAIGAGLALIAGIGPGLIYGVLFYILKFLLRGRLELLEYIKNTILPELIYTVIIGVFVFKFARLIDKKLNPPKQVNLGVESELKDD